MTLPRRYSGVPRKAIKLILTEGMFWEIHNLEEPTGTVQDKIRLILERHLQISRGTPREGRDHGIRFDRVWSMPNRWTFTISPIAQLIKEEMADTEPWIDPFAGMYSPAHVRNDLNPEMNAEYHMDALEFLKSLSGKRFAGGIHDPPYSFRQASECYSNHGLEHLTANVTNKRYWSDVKDELARLIEDGGKSISLGWNSCGMGLNRGFEIDRILLVSHGGGNNDTIVTVETKVQSMLEGVES